jgi:hypothetical protein
MASSLTSHPEFSGDERLREEQKTSDERLREEQKRA